MASKELERFVFKVNQLNQLVESLESVPGRKESLESCLTHEEVVALASSWGFEIGRRWGDD